MEYFNFKKKSKISNKKKDRLISIDSELITVLVGE